jgi:hypothetical protein
MKLKHISSKVIKENCAVYETMLKTIVHPDRPQMAVWYGTNALHAG